MHPLSIPRHTTLLTKERSANKEVSTHRFSGGVSLVQAGKDTRVGKAPQNHWTPRYAEIAFR